MSKLTAAILHDSLDEGRTVSEIAAVCEVSPGRVYQLMRRLDRTATAVAAERTARGSGAMPCRTFGGYRVCGDGRVQSCWSSGPHPVQTQHWRDLTIQINRGKNLYVRMGGSGRRRRPALLTVYYDAFNAIRASKAEALHDEMRRKMGLE